MKTLTREDIKERVRNIHKPVWEWKRPIKSYRERVKYHEELQMLMLLYNIIAED
jgi:hypothetical protein